MSDMFASFKELAERATPRDESGNPVRGLDSEYHEQWARRFGELVARECVNIIQYGMDYTDHADPALSQVELAAQRWCRDAIKEHFEIKP